jgi:hypothetical protein
MVAGHSAQVASAWARNENQNKFHVQLSIFIVFFKWKMLVVMISMNFLGYPIILMSM